MTIVSVGEGDWPGGVLGGPGGDSDGGSVGSGDVGVGVGGGELVVGAGSGAGLRSSPTNSGSGKS